MPTVRAGMVEDSRAKWTESLPRQRSLSAWIQSLLTLNIQLGFPATLNIANGIGKHKTEKHLSCAQQGCNTSV